ncbi:MAG: acyl-CoA dehydrogenase [Planctomycetes bacterium]|nr:acyl-CoA dehydrogenase [Planctomycetota bacterium]
MAQAEEILGDRLDRTSFTKGLFFGQYLADSLPDYPTRVDASTRDMVESLRAFCRESIDPVAIDRDASIPAHVTAGLGKLGVLGACLPRECGGQAMSQTAYCRLLEVLGGHCASTALFVNAHHSIGPRALVLFGTPEQRRTWLPRLATGEWLSAFALTEPEAGSDAANVQTRAEPTADGTAFRLNGEKRWITNGGTASVLTVMARTPTSDGDSKITAFLVTPDMPGFEVVEERMDKCGVRGTVTSRLAFHDMLVPRENVLGSVGKGLRVALTVLDFGRTTFGASCTGAAKTCFRLTRNHVRSRVQFGKPLSAFELVRDRVARMHARIYAMEACTYQTAALIDAAHSDFMIETAMLKVFTTESLWQIVYDAFQLHGGTAYFTDQPFERMMRDARINSIGEGANDVLRIFSALVGMRDVGMELEGVVEAIRSPLQHVPRLGRFVGRTLSRMLVGPEVRVRCSELEPLAARLGRRIASVASRAERLLRTHQREIVDRQCLVARIADAATDLFVSSCVLRRMDAESRTDAAHSHSPSEVPVDPMDLEAGKLFLRLADRRIHMALNALDNHDDEAILAHARRLLDPSGS